MWTLVSVCTAGNKDEWTVISLRQLRGDKRETIYHLERDPSQTHIGMNWRRKGDPLLAEIARAADTYVQLTGKEAGFRVPNAALH